MFVGLRKSNVSRHATPFNVVCTCALRNICWSSHPVVCACVIFVGSWSSEIECCTPRHPVVFTCNAMYMRNICWSSEIECFTPRHPVVTALYLHAMRMLFCLCHMQTRFVLCVVTPSCHQHIHFTIHNSVSNAQLSQ